MYPAHHTTHLYVVERSDAIDGSDDAEEDSDPVHESNAPDWSTLTSETGTHIDLIVNICKFWPWRSSQMTSKWLPWITETDRNHYNRFQNIF